VSQKAYILPKDDSFEMCIYIANDEHLHRESMSWYLPIFVLVGEASCGKYKIAQYVANVIGPSQNFFNENAMTSNDFGRNSLFFNEALMKGNGLPVSLTDH
jgi:hypothetical protein